MKFFMTIAVCSFLDGTCTPHVNYPIEFNSWSACMYEALKESEIVMSQLDQDLVDRHRLATQFMCKESNVY